MFKVTKHIDFCYGHRLLNYEGRCRHLHGHNGRAEVDLAADALDGRGMVVDFTDIKQRIKSWIDETLDHRMLLHREDPILPVLQERGELYFVMDENPTAENIAVAIWNALAPRIPSGTLHSVRLQETENNTVEYRGGAK